MGRSECVRGAEVERSLDGSDVARLSEQVDRLLGGGVRILGFDVPPEVLVQVACRRPAQAVQ